MFQALLHCWAWVWVSYTQLCVHSRLEVECEWTQWTLSLQLDYSLPPVRSPPKQVSPTVCIHVATAQILAGAVYPSCDCGILDSIGDSIILQPRPPVACDSVHCCGSALRVCVFIGVQFLGGYVCVLCSVSRV